VDLRPLTYWDCGFESRLGHGCLSVVSVVCCQVEVSATDWSLVQRSPTECGVSKKCVIVKPRKMRRPRPSRGCRAIGKKTDVTSERATLQAYSYLQYNPFRPSDFYTYLHVTYPKMLYPDHTASLCVLYVSQNKQRYFPRTSLADWFS
jgi:hypothetical protein